MKLGTWRPIAALAVAASLVALAAAPALAQTPHAPTPNKGDTAWMMTASALVLLMTIPGLALFYGGLVRTKNMLSMLMQVFFIVCLICIIWVIYGYSLAFSEGGALNSFIGGFSKAFLAGITQISNGQPVRVKEPLSPLTRGSALAVVEPIDLARHRYSLQYLGMLLSIWSAHAKIPPWRLMVLMKPFSRRSCCAFRLRIPPLQCTTISRSRSSSPSRCGS